MYNVHVPVVAVFDIAVNTGAVLVAGAMAVSAVASVVDVVAVVVVVDVVAVVWTADIVFVVHIASVVVVAVASFAVDTDLEVASVEPIEQLS